MTREQWNEHTKRFTRRQVIGGLVLTALLTCNAAATYAVNHLPARRTAPLPVESTITPPHGDTLTLYHRGIISPDGVQRQITSSTVPTNPKPYHGITFTEEWSETFILPPWK